MKNKSITLEVCADSLCNALTAQSAGADRIEFCANLPEGGVTPSFGQISLARKMLNIRLFVLIRPRGGDFLYNGTEYEIMKADIRLCGEKGCDGVVVGMLNVDGTVDTIRCRELVNIAHQYGMKVTFHRAFDRCSDLFSAMENIIDLGCERILTSGGFESAIDGADVIKKLIEKADGKIIIMPGAGITPDNVGNIIEKTGATEIHGTFRSPVASKMEYKNPIFSDKPEEYFFNATDANKIKKILSEN
ncbi:MAG: copper homeostasis protein CutC [Dysgonamonadaceae bacterium]|nr:copper homeostasis protein CutC [Dysgonamonadaceae bacterium]